MLIGPPAFWETEQALASWGRGLLLTFSLCAPPFSFCLFPHFFTECNFWLNLACRYKNVLSCWRIAPSPHSWPCFSSSMLCNRAQFSFSKNLKAYSAAVEWIAVVLMCCDSCWWRWNNSRKTEVKLNRNLTMGFIYVAVFWKQCY